MGLFSKLFGTEEPAAPQIAMVGQPLHLNVPPKSKTAIVRHLERIISLREALAEPGRFEGERRDRLEAELNRRIHTLAAADIVVPPEAGAVRTLIEEIKNG